MLSFYMTVCRLLTARIEDCTCFSYIFHLIFELPRDYNNNNNNSYCQSLRGSLYIFRLNVSETKGHSCGEHMMLLLLMMFI